MGRRASSRSATAAASALALALALALGATSASAVTPAGPTEPSPQAAIVEVATPALPTGIGAPSREGWRQARARSNAVLARVAERAGLVVQSRVPETGQLTVELQDGVVGELRRRLRADPRVRRVEADRPVQLRYLPNDFAFNIADPNAPAGDFAQWNLRRAGGQGAWDRSKGIAAEVSVIDTGTDVGHPDLGPRTAGVLDCDPAPCGGSNVTDTTGHGTHVAGLACADSDNAYGIASLGFDCNLFVAKIATCADAEAAIVAAANRGTAAINMSFGGCTATLANAIAYAFALGSVPVAAAANTPNPTITYPSQAVQPRGTGANIDLGQGLVVTGVKYDGTRAAIAESTTGVSVAAHGFASDAAVGGQQGILSTWPAATTSIDTGSIIPSVAPCGCRTGLNGDTRFAYLVGTSMATPQVAGVVALMRSANPALPAPKLVRLIKLTASNCASYQGGIGWGLINADAAVAAAAGTDLISPESSVERKRKSKRKLRITGFDGSGCSTELPSSGIENVMIFASRNGKAYRRIAKTEKTTFRFKPKRKGRYRFYSIAVDKAGNEEAAPTRSDEKLRVRSTSKGSKKGKR